MILIRRITIGGTYPDYGCHRPTGLIEAGPLAASRLPNFTDTPAIVTVPSQHGPRFKITKCWGESSLKQPNFVSHTFS